MIRCLHLLMVFAMAQLLSAGVFYHGKIEAGPTGKLESTDRLRSSDGQTLLIMQSAGNLVLLDDGSELWSTGTGGNAGAAFWLNVQSDGNLCIYPDGSTINEWCSGSGGHSSEAPLYLAIGDGCICMIGENGIFWSQGNNDCDAYNPYDIADLNIFDELPAYLPIRWTNQEPYVCTATLLDDYGYSGISYDQCAAACYNNDLCTYFMLQWSASEFDLCRLVHLCDRRASDSNDWEIYELNRNDAVNFIESASEFSVLWSTKRAFKLWYGPSTVKLTNADESLTVWSKTADRLWLQNQGRIAFQSCDDSSCSSYTASSQLCSPDLSTGPYTLYVMDYGQLVIKNSNGAITCVIGYDDEAALEVPYNDEEAYIASCSGIDFVSDNSASTADYARYGLLATAKVCEGIGAVPVASAFSIAALSVDLFQKKAEHGGDGIMQCIEDYVSYRINTLSESMNLLVMANFKSKMKTVIENILDCDTTACHLNLWNNDASHELLIGEAPIPSDEYPLIVYPRTALPLIANLMNLRLYHWAQIMSLLGCTDSDCVTDYIDANEDCDQYLKQDMVNFRTHNGDLIETYLDYIAEVWHDIMEDTTISTQQKIEEIQAIWMDGAVCSLWIPRTYAMSQKYDSCAVCDEPTGSCTFNYNWIKDSYVFYSYDLTAYPYGDDTPTPTYDLTSGSMGDDCKNIVYEWIAEEYTSSNNHELSWNGFTELGEDPFNEYKVDSHCSHTSCGSGYDRCLTEEIGDNERCISCIGGNEYVSKLWVLPFVPDLVSGIWTNKNEISDAILDSLPLMQAIKKAQCRHKTTFSPTVINPTNNNDLLQFFGNNNKNECWQKPNNPISSQTQVSGQCATSDEIAVGISFYRAIERHQTSGEAGYFLWKIRLQCMRVSYGSERIYDIDLWSTSSLAGSHYSDSGGGGGAAGNYEYEGWSPFKTCPPGYAINEICADKGWISSGSSYRKESRIDYGINVNCKRL